MKQKKAHGKNNFIMCRNAGLSLVEVIIALAIMSIVLLSALQLVLSGSKMYTKTNESVDAQTEAQLLESQLNNLIVDAEYSVYAAESADSSRITDDVSGFSADAYIKVFNNSVAYYIAWLRSDDAGEPCNKVFYLEKKVTDGSVEELTEEERNVANWYLMGEGIVGFSPDSSYLTEKQRLVRIKIQVEKGQVSYETIQNISLRNNVLSSNDLGEIYSDEEIERDEAVTSVTIVQSASSANRNGSVNFEAVVMSGSSPAASQNVVWNVTGKTSADTRVESSGSGNSQAVLLVGADESATVLTVTATAEGTDVYGQASVVVPMIQSVSVTTGDTTPPAGGRSYFTAQVIGLNLDSDARKVLWSVDPAVAGVSISDSGVLTIGSGVTPGTIVTVRATVSVTAGGDTTPVTGTCAVTVSEAGTGGPRITTETGNYQLKRNGGLALYVSGESRNIIWSIVDDGGLGDKISISSSGVVTAERDIDFTKEYTIKVKAMPVGGTSSEAIIQTITLPKVSISFDQTEAYTVALGTIGRIPYTLEGLENTGELSVSSTPSFSSQSGTFIYCTGSELVIVTGSGMGAQTITVTVSLIDNATVRSTVSVQVTN